MKIILTNIEMRALHKAGLAFTAPLCKLLDLPQTPDTTLSYDEWIENIRVAHKNRLYVTFNAGVDQCEFMFRQPITMRVFWFYRKAAEAITPFAAVVKQLFGPLKADFDDIIRLTGESY